MGVRGNVAALLEQLLHTPAEIVLKVCFTGGVGPFRRVDVALVS